MSLRLAQRSARRGDTSSMSGLPAWFTAGPTKRSPSTDQWHNPAAFATMAVAYLRDSSFCSAAVNNESIAARSWLLNHLTEDSAAHDRARAPCSGGARERGTKFRSHRTNSSFVKQNSVCVRWR